MIFHFHIYFVLFKGPDISDKAEVIRVGGQTNGQSSPQPGDEGPLNLSLKPVPERNNHNNSALQSLSALSQTLGQTDRSKHLLTLFILIAIYKYYLMKI